MTELAYWRATAYADDLKLEIPPKNVFWRGDRERSLLNLPLGQQGKANS
jgi:hypothetical protein